MRGDETIEPGHVMLGLLAENGGVAITALKQLGIDLEQVKTNVLDSMGPGGGVEVEGHVAFTTECKKVFEKALHVSLDMEDNYIGTEHLMLALGPPGDAGAFKEKVEAMR